MEEAMKNVDDSQVRDMMAQSIAHSRATAEEKYANLNETHDRVQNRADAIDRVISSAPARESDAIVYRGGSMPDGLKPGDRFTDKGFVSTTAHREVADKFAADRGGQSLKIEMPAGTRAAPIDLVTHATGGGRGGEGEWLLNRGTTFEVVDNNTLRVVN